MSGAVAFVVSDLEKHYGSTTVLEGASVSIHQRTKVGFIGRNGAGKSTLIRLLLQQEEPDSGSITRANGLRVGYLEQHDAFTTEETAGAFLERHTGREEWRCGQLAHKLGLTPENLATPMGVLSGGYRTRVKLAAMLLADPDFLVLDEPTNFLDLTTVLLLQDFLADFRGGVLVVSHDREFLKATCDHTLHVERGGLTMYPGHIEEFFVWKTEQMAVARRTNAAVEAKRKHLQAFVDRFGAKASKATQAKSKAKAIERLKPISVANPLSTARINIPKAGGRPGYVIAAEKLDIGYPGHTIAGDVNVAIEKGDKVAIVGDNGQGKTTLLRTLAGDLDVLDGAVKLGNDSEISYYAQHVYQSLRPNDTVFEHLEASAPRDITRQQVLAMAGAMLFRGDDVEKPISVLSGGERARVSLAGLLLAKKPVLILDEPTNHLDFETVEALGAALKEFDGAVLFVSHDRTFVNMAATQIVEVDQGRVRRLPGSYADYVEQLQVRARKSSAPSKKSAGSDAPAKGKKQKAAAAAELTPKQLHAERRRRKNARQTAERKLRAVEARMAELEAQKVELHAAIAATPADRSLYTQLAEADAGLAAAEPEWLEWTTKLESLPV